MSFRLDENVMLCCKLFSLRLYQLLIIYMFLCPRYVETLKGRKRFLSKIKFGNSKEKSKAQRQAVNSICQVQLSPSLRFNDSVIFMS